MLFPFKPFHLMDPEDWAAIGLKCGLEIHQQLLTKRKLFCRCPAGRYSDEYDAVILRHMRPTLSELGEYDGTALMEKKTRKNIFYRIHQDTCCTYDMDDTPPFFIDDEALDIALEVALLLNLNMVSELHIARKQYLDGSIPTGFQRTTIVGVDGWIPFRGRKIGIRQLGLEEDACREVSDNGHDRIYLTDRLGMPLIEPVTEPEMRTPEETAAVAQLLRRLTRSTGRVRTGYGAGRQDVNVSVEGGTRIEIKGVPRIAMIPILVYNEAMRQCSLLRIRDKLSERGVTPETFEAVDFDVTHALKQTAHAPIASALSRGDRVRCAVLKGFAGLLKETTQTDTVFAREFSDRVRVIACLTELPNIIHSDAASEFLTAGEWQKVRRRVRATPDDALILVWGAQADVECACRELTIRAREATEGVPSDTRQALKDGTNGFERVLPGADRMYPDTDLPPIAVGTKRLARIRDRLPEPVWEREERYAALGLRTEMVERLSISPRARLFDRIVAELPVDAGLAATILTERMTALRRAGEDVDALEDDTLHDLFAAHGAKRLAREGIVKVLRHLLRHGGSVDGALRTLGLDPIADDDEIARHIAAALESAAGKSFARNGARHRHVMGCLMKDLLGRVAGRRLAEGINSAEGRKGQS